MYFDFDNISGANILTLVAPHVILDMERFISCHIPKLTLQYSHKSPK